MKDNTTAPEVARTDNEIFPREPKIEAVELGAKRVDESIDNELPASSSQLSDRTSVIRFCRELAVIMIRQFAKDGDAAALRVKLAASLIRTLDCTPVQAQCLIDLALEIIHAKIHGKYRRSALDLSYLMATATGVVSDVSTN